MHNNNNDDDTQPNYNNSNKSIVNDQDNNIGKRDTQKLNDKRFSMNNLS